MPSTSPPVESPDAVVVATQADPATNAEHLVYMAAGLWLMAGLALDGWAHRYQPELETFFTPWHGVFYGGFTATVAAVAVMAIRRRPHVESLRAAIPPGYELSIVGFAMFAAGGIGDGIWHTVFGIESSLDALLSPTHLLMLAGMSIAFAAPIRAAQRLPLPYASGFSSFLPALLAATLISTGAAFFFMYANGFSNWPTTRDFYPYQDEVPAALGVLSTLVSTVILLVPVLYLVQRWRPPFGSFTLAFGLVGASLAGLDAFTNLWQLMAPTVGGLTADLAIRHHVGSYTDRPPPAVLGRLGTTLGVMVPVVMWMVSTLATHQAWTVRWPPELWFGQIVMATLCGYCLSLLARPPAH